MEWICQHACVCAFRQWCADHDFLINTESVTHMCRHVINWRGWGWGAHTGPEGEESGNGGECIEGKVDLLAHHLDLGDLEMQLN